MSTRSYKDLLVWKKAMDLAVASYELTRLLPSHERFALTDQMRRAAVSVPANIAEGNGRLRRGAYRHHLSIARGSLKELETHIALGQRLGYLPAASCATAEMLADEVSRLLTALLRALPA